jgi:hypothetical protein
MANIEWHIVQRRELTPDEIDCIKHYLGKSAHIKTTYVGDLPSEDVRLLISFDNELKVQTGYFYVDTVVDEYKAFVGTLWEDDGLYEYEQEHINAWAYLPAPYKREDNDNGC